MKYATLLIAFIAALAAGCASSKVVRAPSSSCRRVPQLFGTWKSYRLSSLGPAWMTVTFNCDCTAHVVAQSLFMRYTEDVPYRVENGAIIFTRKNSETRWPYSFDSNALVLFEASNEQHRYTRSTETSCRSDMLPN